MASHAPAIEIASAIQSASINRHPSPTHDINPSTTMSAKEPVRLSSASMDDGGIDEDEIPISILRPVPRRHTMPPLPDMRFEQSYLRSIEKADGWTGVGYITVRDQVFMPLIQGFAWSLIVFGWRHLNSASRFSGASLGARIRRWWWGVNNWKLPEKKGLKGTKLAGEVRDFYKYQFSSAGGD